METPFFKPDPRDAKSLARLGLDLSWAWMTWARLGWNLSARLAGLAVGLGWAAQAETLLEI